MKKFFSIKILHEFDGGDSNPLGVSNDLVIIPSNVNDSYVKNNRLLFRSEKGALDCFVENDYQIKPEVAQLYFWVVCTDEAFYSYTELQNEINFSNPYYFWSNSKVSTSLQRNDFYCLHSGLPPKHAIGCIAVLLNTIASNETLDFVIEFNIRKTFWEYHIFPQKEPDSFAKATTIKYDIIDFFYKNGKASEHWEFEKTMGSNENEIIYRSKTSLPYSKRASDRLKLVWRPESESNLPRPQEMILPFANYAYKTVDKDKMEYTPIYIHF